MTGSLACLATGGEQNPSTFTSTKHVADDIARGNWKIRGAHSSFSSASVLILQQIHSVLCEILQPYNLVMSCVLDRQNWYIRAVSTTKKLVRPKY